MGPGTGVQLGGRAFLCAPEVSIGAVYQFRLVHDGEVPRVIYRKEHIRHADSSKVAVSRSLLETRIIWYLAGMTTWVRVAFADPKTCVSIRGTSSTLRR